jgi:hypothetical protein
MTALECQSEAVERYELTLDASVAVVTTVIAINVDELSQASRAIVNRDLEW